MGFWRCALCAASLVGWAAVYLVAADWFGRREGKVDATLFTDNPTTDTYKNKFHRQRLTCRALALVAGGLLGGLGVTCSGLVPPRWAWPLTVALIGWGAALWNHEFTLTLNRERHLAYVPEYYVSANPEGAGWDHWITKIAGWLKMAPSALLERVLLWPIRFFAFGWCAQWLVFCFYLFLNRR